MQIEGLVHLEKTADKWGKNKQGDEWQEQWWEHYGASGKGDKWAHKWCSIDPNTPLRMVVLMFGMNGTKSVLSMHSYLMLKTLFFCLIRYAFGMMIVCG